MGVRLPPGALFLHPSGNINFVKKYRHIFLAFFIACSQASTDVSSEQEAPPTTEAPPTIASEELSENEKKFLSGETQRILEKSEDTMSTIVNEVSNVIKASSFKNGDSK